MLYSIKRSEQEIVDVMNKAADGFDNGTKWPGMSYEEGVLQALQWLFGETNDNPMED